MKLTPPLHQHLCTSTSAPAPLHQHLCTSTSTSAPKLAPPQHLCACSTLLALSPPALSPPAQSLLLTISTYSAPQHLNTSAPLLPAPPAPASSKWQRLTIVTPKSYHLSPLSKRWICSTTTTQDDIKQGTDRLFFDFCFMSYEPITTSSSKWQRLAIVIPKSYHLSSSS
jgi:hypothetical protein